jgi:hypothetical protein
MSEIIPKKQLTREELDKQNDIMKQLFGDDYLDFFHIERKKSLVDKIVENCLGKSDNNDYQSR